MKKPLLSVSFFVFAFLISNAYAQPKWKKFNSKSDGYTLLLPSCFELGPRLSGGIIQWFMDSTSNVQIWVEVQFRSSPFPNKLDSLFLEKLFIEHKGNFSNVSKEILREKWFVIEGYEGLGALDQTQLNNSKMHEKCIVVNDRICILRILYTDYDKSFLDVPKISESFRKLGEK
ncbi:MAG: hypothetical protein ACKO7P_07240 [Bacteroidota bacterium]